jgi:hypothetical protein
MRILRRGYRDAQLAAAPFLDARQHDTQLAGRKRGGRAPGIEGSVQPHGAREAPERALRQVKRRVPGFTPGGKLAAPYHDDSPAEDHLDVGDGDPGQVRHDFDGIGGFDDVQGRDALASQAAWMFALEEFEEPPGLLTEVAPFEEDASH